MSSSGQLSIIGVSVSDVRSQLALIWDTDLSGFRLLTLQDLQSGIYISGVGGTGSGSSGGPTNRIVSQNDPTTYIDLSNGIRIVVAGEERINYGT